MKEIVVPDIGTTSDVTVIEVLVKVGDTIAVEQPLITLESEKASMEIPSPEAGVVESIAVKMNDKVKVGSVILKMKTAETTKDSSFPQQRESSSVKAPEKPLDSRIRGNDEEKKGNDGEKKTNEGRAGIYAGPGVRRLARELNIDLSTVTPTGPKSRIQREDILARVKQGSGGSTGVGLPSAPSVDFSAFGETEIKPLSKIKKLTATNLYRNWLLVPHVTQFDEADITELEAFRKKQSDAGVKLTPLVFVMKAVVFALKQYPQFNASLDANGENLILKKYFHLGIAVDTPDGLVVPVIRNVEQKSLTALAKELAEVSEKARHKQLLPKDMQGSSFTISSLGGIGGTAFTPIVNLPDVAILGVSKMQVKPVYQNDQFVPRKMLPLSLSYDHRIIDGAEGARFVVALNQALSDIRLLLM